MKQFVYILDTNVLLHDTSAIFSFGQHDILIPITVLEELDKLKKGRDGVSAKARGVIRTIEHLTEIEQNIYSLGEEKGTLRIAVNDEFLEQDKNILNDNAIIDCARYYTNNDKTKTYILISKDINLRIKAKSLGVKTQDYDKNDIDNYNFTYTGYRTVQIDLSQFEELSSKRKISSSIVDSPIANEYYIVKSEGKTLYAKYDAHERNIVLIEEQSVFGISPKNVQQIFLLDALMDRNIPMVSVSGIAGTGKTLLAIAAALANKKHYVQIHLAKSVEVVGKELGFLPGTLEEKLAPFTESYMDAFEFIFGGKKAEKSTNTLNKLFEEGKILFSATQFLRGRSLPGRLFIVDEIQNLTEHEVKTLITRMGEGSKIILMGDIDQIDTHSLNNTNNGLSHVISNMKGSPLYAHITLSKGERSPLATEAAKRL